MMTEIEGVVIDERKLHAGVEIIGQSIGDHIDVPRETLARFPAAGRLAGRRDVPADLSARRHTDRPEVSPPLHDR